jgi:hypothetical protein
MSTTDIALNLGILALMILTQFGRHRWDVRKLLLPLGIVAGVGYIFLPGAPTIGHDVALDIVGIAAGVVCGLLAAACVAVGRVTRRGASSPARGSATSASGRRWSAGDSSSAGARATPGRARSGTSRSRTRSPARTRGGPPSS